MSYQRSKAPLALMEQIIMILVFALAAAVCMQAFVYSNELSKEGARKEQASTYVQEVAEYCKAYHGDFSTLRDMLGGRLEEETLIISYEEEDMKVKVEKSDDVSEYLEKATVYAENGKGEVIFSIGIAWQKNASEWRKL